MKIFETLGAGLAQAARPLPLPERDPRDVGLVVETSHIQGLVSSYMTQLGARPMGSDYSAFQVPGSTRPETIDLLTHGNRRRDVKNATEGLLLAFTQERRASQPSDITPAEYTRWFNLNAVRALSRHASPTNTDPVTDALTRVTQILLTDIADRQDPRVQEILDRLSHGTRDGNANTSASAEGILARRSIHELLTSLMTDPSTPSSPPSEPPTRHTAA